LWRKSDEVIRGWRKLHNEELVLFTKHNENDQVKDDEMDRSCSMHGEKRNAYRISVGQTEGRRPLGRPKHRRKCDIKWFLEK
jgi:hypothetical protein